MEETTEDYLKGWIVMTKFKAMMEKVIDCVFVICAHILCGFLFVLGICAGLCANRGIRDWPMLLLGLGLFGLTYLCHKLAEGDFRKHDEG